MEDSMDFGDWSSIVSPSDTESIKVLVRIRPVESSVETCVNLQSAQALSIEDIDHKKTFACHYDSVLGPNATQAQVYDIVKEYTHSVLQGVNCTIFAYGQTGSGKTHSMYGPPNYMSAHGRETESLGVIPRAIHHIFELAKSPEILDFQLHVSFVQIYNENLFDMLRDGTMLVPLTIRGDGDEIYVQGLSEYNVKSVGDTLQLLKIAEHNRAVRETHMNQVSSRSHSIFTVNVEYKKVDLQDGGGEVSYKAKFNLVDLAGSEKWDTNRSMSADHIAEMTKINLSLHSLGKCIAALAKASRRRNKQPRERSVDKSDVYGDDNSSVGKSMSGLNNTGNTSNTNNTNNQYSTTHIPYRESKLTRLLQDSLGGNAKTFLIATVSPARYNCDETISTLKFADRAKQVMTQATINEFRPVDHAVVKRLNQENELYKTLVRKLYEESGFSDAFRRIIVSAPFDVLALSNHLPTASMATSPMPYHQKHNKQSQQDMSTSMSQFPYSNNHLMSSPSPSVTSSPTKKQNNVNHNSQALQTSDNNQESRLEYILSLERALNKEQVHAQHLTKKNETLIKELEDMKLMNMQLSFQPSLQSNNHHSQNITNNATQQQQIWCDTIMQIPETTVTELNASVSDLMRQNEELLTNTEHLQKTMQRFFKFHIEEDDMKRDVLQVFDVIKRLKGYITAQRVNENFQALQSLQDTLQRLKKEMSAANTNHPSSYAGKQLQPLNHSATQYGNHGQDEYDSQQAFQTPNHHQYLHQNIAPPNQSQSQPYSASANHASWSAPSVDSRAVSAASSQPNYQHRYPDNNNNNYTDNGDSRASSASTSASAPSAMKNNTNNTVYRHQDFDFYQEQQLHHSQQSSNKNQNQQQYQSQNRQSQASQSLQSMQSQKHRQLAPIQQQYSPLSQEFPAASGAMGMNRTTQGGEGGSNMNNYDNSYQNNNSGGGGITFRVRHGPHASSHNKLPMQLQQQQYQQQQQQQQQHQHRGGGNDSVASAESVLGGLAILESEEEIMAREYKEAKARQKKKEKLAQWMKEKEERAKAELRQQEEEKKAMYEAEKERESKRREYVQKQKAKLTNYHDKVKHESEKIQELINLGIDPKSLNL